MWTIIRFPAVKKWLTDIREGRVEDKYNWMWKV